MSIFVSTTSFLPNEKKMSAKHCCEDPWPQLMIACARVVEIYSKIFDKPELLKISMCLRNVCKVCDCKARLKEDGESETKTLYTFTPTGLNTQEDVDEFYSVYEGENVPKIGTEGAKFRDETLLKQNPVQDESVEGCKFVGEASKDSFEEFRKIRADSSGDGVARRSETDDESCAGCNGSISSGSFYVAANRSWHPACFRCKDCDVLLQDLKYCLHENDLFCNRHYAEKIRPRCTTCDELIFDETCTRAMGKNWHVDHFWCKDCNVILTGKKYAQKDGKPYCLKCYESSFGKSCEKCTKTIGANAKYLIYKKKHWHESCFACKFCRESLVGKEFISKDNEIYCEKCHEDKLAPRCASCSKTIRSGAKTIEYKTKRFHEECFVCSECHAVIKTKKFAAKQDRVFCDGCHQEKFGTKCTECRKTITKGGVTYRNRPWHTECFSCSNCPKLLSGVTFTSQNDRPFCADCFGILFAKKCFACREPINGEGTRFINHDNHHWHNNCFFCAACRCNLGGKGFIMEDDVILCPKCARTELQTNDTNTF